LQIRAKEEQLVVEKPEDLPLHWFRDKDSDTLARFEKINLRVFLASLDSDPKLLDAQGQQKRTLTELEATRSRDLRKALQANNGRMKEASSDPRVLDDDKALFDLLDQ
jgi:tRNA pseudouridine-54 N-methylase